MNWYEVMGPDEIVSQGDIFFECPVYSIDASTINYASPYGAAKAKTIAYIEDFVVLTQACDLEPNIEGKVELGQVIVAPIYDVETMETVKNKWDFVSEVHAGKRPNYYLLANSEIGVTMGFKIVDFSNIITVPYEFLSNYRKYNGDGNRLRIKSPHRELLSQKFGYYFMRIGLPRGDSIDKTELKRVVQEIKPIPELMRVVAKLK